MVSDSGAGAVSNALEFKEIRHFYGRTLAVDGLTLDVKAGEVVCLLGPSGCGKTTALRVAAGLEPLTEGEVWLEGRKVADPMRMVPPEERAVGLVFQDYALFPHLTILENIAFGLIGLRGSAKEKRCRDVLHQVGMDSYANAYPHELSGGQQQRIALARALAPGPNLVLMDEPFSGLDARLREQVRDRTLHVLKQAGAAVLMVTHDAEEAMYMADRIAVMRDGRLVQLGTPEDLYMHPADGFVAAFFGWVNRMDGRVAGGAVDTPLGLLEAPGCADGAQVEVVIRPEAVNLTPADGSDLRPGYAKVLASRMLGGTSLVHLCTCRTSGEEFHLHARVPGRYLPVEGQIEALTLDRSQVFVFPLEGGK